MAEIITLIRGAVRSGLYAARSITNPSTTVSTITSGSDIPSGRLALRYTIIRPAAMNTSPWAKLISRRIPYTIVYPMAISAYCPPSEIPDSSMEIAYCTGIPPISS